MKRGRILIGLLAIISFFILHSPVVFADTTGIIPVEGVFYKSEMDIEKQTVEKQSSQQQLPKLSEAAENYYWIYLGEVFIIFVFTLKLVINRRESDEKV